MFIIFNRSDVYGFIQLVKCHKKGYRIFLHNISNALENAKINNY